MAGMKAGRKSRCYVCSSDIYPGSPIAKHVDTGRWVHRGCAREEVKSSLDLSADEILSEAGCGHLNERVKGCARVRRKG